MPSTSLGTKCSGLMVYIVCRAGLMTGRRHRSSEAPSLDLQERTLVGDLGMSAKLRLGKAKCLNQPTNLLFCSSLGRGKEILQT